MIAYQYTVRNDTNAQLEGPFTVTDTKTPGCTIAGPLAKGATGTCSASYTILAADLTAGYVNNTASATGNGLTSPFDSDMITIPMECINDADGPDVQGQKDLTTICQDAFSVDPLILSWNWDEVNIGTGGNNADGCALFDTDGDGNINVAACVAWNGAGVLQSVAIYSCNDTKPDRCPDDTLRPSSLMTCAVSNSSDDPFTAGDWFPKDTKAYCAIPLASVGTGANYVDTCSYPSGRNTAPGDCVAISAAKANLNVVKNVVPDAPTTNWVMTVSGPTSFTDTLIGDDDTGVRAVDPGTNYSIVETGGTDTDITGYDTTWACYNGDPYSSGSATTISGVALAKGDLVSCTFTNTRKTGSLKISKTVSNPDGATLPATFTMDYNCGTGYTGQVPVAYPTPGFETVPGIPTGNTCTVTEVAPATITDYTWGAPTYTPESVTISEKNGTYEIVVGNSITKNRGSLVVTKTVNWNGVTPDATKTFPICVSGTSYGPDCKLADSDGGNLTWDNLVPGNYTVTETDPGPLWSVTGSGQTVTVPAGGTGTATITNARRVPAIDVTKTANPTRCRRPAAM